MTVNKKWRNQFQRWKNKEIPDENILKLLRRYRKIELDLEIIRSSLSSIHQHIDPQYLEPFCFQRHYYFIQISGSRRITKSMNSPA